MQTAPTLTVQATVHAPAEQVWQRWTTPADITQWNAASDDWHTPEAENDVRPGGHFRFRMAARDGSFSFDLTGTYDQVQPPASLHYTLADGRKVAVKFTAQGAQTVITQTFEAETQHPLDMQQAGWQSILNNFKRYAEGQQGA